MTLYLFAEEINVIELKFVGNMNVLYKSLDKCHRCLVIHPEDTVIILSEWLETTIMECVLQRT